MEWILLIGVAFGASMLTFFSGFGLGTLLTPVFILFFPSEIAISLTAIVHFLNNLFKIGLTFRNINYQIVLKFGLPALVAAWLGANVLEYLSEHKQTINYGIFGASFSTNLIDLVVGILLIIFSIFELAGLRKSLRFEKFLIPGGFISGFFGGVSGNQGALRSVFLINTGLSKEAFIASGIAIACLVDIGRISKYKDFILGGDLGVYLPYLGAAIISAFAGAIIGRKALTKMKIESLHILVGVLIILVGIKLVLGLG